MTQLGEQLQKVIRGLKKYKYALVVLLLGMALLLIPSKTEKTASEKEVRNTTDYAHSMEARLTQALSQIEGVGKVQVVLTLANEGTIHYHSDVQRSREENENGSTEREEQKTVILSEGSAYDEAAVSSVDTPRFQGALIVCEGGANASVRLRLTQAVAALTGLSSEKITVVKMK